MPTENITILLIEDDWDDRYIFDLAIKEISDAINVIHIGYCEEAIVKLSEKSITPNYMFLDLNMPKMQGHECLVHLKKIEHLNQIPIVIYSTSRRIEEIERLLKEGAHYYIHKSNTFSEIVDEIKGFLEK